MKLSGQWTPEERIYVAVVLLTGIQRDIYAGCYSVPGRPNITSVQHLLTMPAEELGDYLEITQKLLDEHDAERSEPSDA
jgi:hypothetical protein